jgi:predicted dehydrogenase
MVYRAAVIGCGKIGSEFADDPRIGGVYTHAEAYVKCPDTVLTALCDSDPERLAKCGRRWNVSDLYADHHELLDDQKPDIVSVCTPDATHEAIIRSALEAGGVAAILAEKPLTTDVNSAIELARLVRERQVVLEVNYSRRFDPCHQRIRGLIGGGTIGPIQAVNGYYTKGTLHTGTHLFDLLRYLVGEVSRVRGIDTLHEPGEDPTLDACIEFESGVTGFFHGCDAKAFSIFELDLIGRRGRIRITESGHGIEIYTIGESPHYSGYLSPVLHERYRDCMKDLLLHAVEDVVQCVRTRKKPLCSVEDGLRALQIADSLAKSAREGRMLSVRSP